MFEGEGLISILKMGLKMFLIEYFKTFGQQCCLNILCVLFIKHFMVNA